MKKLSFSKLVGGILAGKDGAANPWRPEGKPYPRLRDIDPVADGMRGQHGLYAVWHLGVRPQWLRVGAADDLGVALMGLVDVPWITLHGNNGGVFVVWAFIRPEQAGGMVRYLADKLRPAYQAEAYSGDRPIDPAVAPITIALPPGTR